MQVRTRVHREVERCRWWVVRAKGQMVVVVVVVVVLGGGFAQSSFGDGVGGVKLRMDFIKGEKSEVQRVERIDLQRRGEVRISIVREVTKEVSSWRVVNDDEESRSGEVVALKQDLRNVGRWGEVGWA